MKQARQFSGFGIKARKIRAFVEIAVVAGKRQIFRRIFSTVLAGSDVFDVKRQWFLRLPQPAVFAVMIRAQPDELAQPGVHQPALARMRRDFA